MDGARYINEYEGAKGSAIAARAQKGGENRARDRKNDGAGERFGSEVECVQSLIMAARKETAAAFLDCAAAFLSEVM